MALLGYRVLIEKLAELSESDLRKTVRAFLSEKVSEGNVQPYHGQGEHGKDTLASIAVDNDPLGKGQILIIQEKKGDVSYGEWEKKIAPQFEAALRSKEYPYGMGADNPRRFILVTNGKIQPEAFKAIKEWNKHHSVPIEVFDIDGLYHLFSRHRLTDTDIDELLEIAKLYNF